MHMFETIGRIGDYTRMKNLRRDMNYRLRTGQSLAQALGMPQDMKKTQSAALLPQVQESDELRSMRIRQKLRQGQKLSSADKQYLRDHDPDLYEKVSRIEERREELARALKRAKTKEEALRAGTLANIAVLAEMRATGGAEAPSLRRAVQGGGGGAAAAGTSVAFTAGADGVPDTGGEAAALDMPAEPSSAEMNAAIAGDAIGKDAAPDAAAQRADTDAPGTEESPREEMPQATQAFGGHRALTPAEKDELRRSALTGTKLTPLDTEHVYQLRAYQREWMEYSNSKAYKELPDTPLDAAKKELDKKRKKYPHSENAPALRPAPTPAEILMAAQRYYHTAQVKEFFSMRG